MPVLKGYISGAWERVAFIGPPGPRGVDAADAFVVPAITFGETSGPGASGNMIRADCALQLLFATDTETVYPDGNTLILSGGTGMDVAGDEATHTITLSVDASGLDHGAFLGLADDDHSIYLLADGTRGLTGAWDVGAFDVTAQRYAVGYGQFEDGATAGYGQLDGTGYFQFSVGGSRVLRMSSYQFIPNSDGLYDAGDGSYRFKVAYALDGNFSQGLIMSNNAAGYVLRANGTRYVPAAGLSTTTDNLHTHSYRGYALNKPEYQVFTYTGSGGSHAHVTI